MDKNKLAAIEILSKVKDSLGNIIASGEYTNDDKRNLLKTKAALKWLREGKETPDELHPSNCIKHAVTVSLPLSNEQILKGIQNSPRYQLPKEWLKNEHTNSNYMGGFLNAVKWMEGNAR